VIENALMPVFVFWDQMPFTETNNLYSHNGNK
jgi:hypothetical protein